MKNIIVGTAGHVDHGKTCLIKALSGTDTDRLKEEKKRGITIELGFANLENTEDFRIGIIDVPGHEKFVRNMLAGIGGIDLVLFVIGLDEGIMPQTVEHFEIIKSIGIKKGIIVYTKSDIAEDGIRQVIDDDVNRLVKGSFLEDAERIEVSAYTGKNIDFLKQRILELAKDISSRREEKELFRLPIDRVFTMEGFGTVVTGTLTEGCVEIGDEVEVYPTGKRLRIRQIQNHNEIQSCAKAGQRTALNLAGVSKEDLDRGEVLAFPSSIILSTRIDVMIELFPSTKRKLKNGDRIHINYGSRQTECRAMLVGENFWQLVFDNPVPIKRGDRFIIRFLSPVETFGGGTVLRIDAPRHKNTPEARLRDFNILENLSHMNLEDSMMVELSRPLKSSDLAVKVNCTVSEAENVLKSLYKDGSVIRLQGNDTKYISKVAWKSIVNRSEEILEQFHKANPLVEGMAKEEFKQQLGIEELVVEGLVKRGIITVSFGFVAKAGFTAGYSKESSGLKEKIENTYLEAGIMVPDTQTLVSQFDDQQSARQIIINLAKEGKLIKFSNSAYIHTKCFNDSFELMRNHFRENKTLSLAQFRDITKASRKYALMFLEFCDYRGYTKMTGDVRIPLGIKL